MKTTDLRVLEFIELGEFNKNILKQYIEFLSKKGYICVIYARKIVTEM
jgi:hypothetical protein